MLEVVLRLLSHYPCHRPESDFEALRNRDEPGFRLTPRMIPKFANPHSQIHELEPVSRAQLRSDADGPSDAGRDASDVEATTSKRKLHELLLSEFGECLSGASGHVPRKKRRLGEDGTTTAPSAEDGVTCMFLRTNLPLPLDERLIHAVFRLLSSAGLRAISTAPKPPPAPKYLIFHRPASFELTSDVFKNKTARLRGRSRGG